MDIKTKDFKEWVNSLPDDSIILVLASKFMSIPLEKPSFLAISGESIKEELGLFKSGKAISSFPED